LEDEYYSVFFKKAKFSVQDLKKTINIKSLNTNFGRFHGSDGPLDVNGAVINSWYLINPASKTEPIAIEIIVIFNAVDHHIIYALLTQFERVY